MDTFADVAPAAGPNSMPPRLRPRTSQAAPTAEATPPAGRPRPMHSEASRVSIDPLHATDRYRLVMPYDQRL